MASRRALLARAVRAAPRLVALAALIAAIALVVWRGDRSEGPTERGPAGSEAIAEVLRVIDGDTIVVSLDGRPERVRYIGVDTPETVKPGSPVECYGERASRFNERLVGGRTARLVFDRELHDRYERLLAYVHVGGRFVNAELVRRGYARTLEIAPNTSRAGRLSRLEQDAARAGRGLWGAC